MSFSQEQPPGPIAKSKPNERKNGKQTAGTALDDLKHLYKGNPWRVKGQFFCIACGKEFSYKANMTQHLKISGELHDGRCAHCEEKFDSWHEHKKHLDQVHNGKFIYRCGFCGEKFLSSIKYIIHTKTTKQANGEGEGCMVKMKYLEKTKGVFVCSKCGKKFTNGRILQWHMENVHEKGSFKCGECEMVFETPSKLSNHKRNKHSESVTCEHCGKLCNSKKLYRKHLADKHTADEDKPFHCSHCGKGFTEERAMKVHTYTHTGEKPYHCDLCDKSFGDRSTVRQHKRSVHLGLKRHGKS